MPAPTITDLPAAPLRSQGPATFAPTAETFVTALQPFVDDVNAFGAYLDALGLSATDQVSAGAFWFPFVSRTTTAEPGAPGALDAYIVPSGATGTNWAGQDGKIAIWSASGGVWIFLTPVEGVGGWIGNEDLAISYNGTGWIALNLMSVTVALSDMTSNLTVGADKGYWDPPFPISIKSVSAAAFEAPTGAAIDVDINEAGVSILSTHITIDAGEVRSADSVTPPVISDALVSGRITFDLDQVGSTNAGKGLQVTIEYVEA